MWAKIKSWICKNWIWILFPVGILLVIVSACRGREKKPQPKSPDPTIAADIALHDNASREQERQAEAATAAEIKEIEEKHHAVLTRLDEEQRQTYEELKKRPAKEITEWLLKVGKGDATR